MSSTEPPVGSTPGQPTPPPATSAPPPSVDPTTAAPPTTGASAAAPPATAASYPAPPPAPGGYGAPGTPVAPQGVPRPGELLDRFLARLIDGVLLGIVFGILYGILGAILISEASVDSQGFHARSTVLFFIVLGIVSALINLAYYAYMESSRGQTVGKIVMKLRTFGPDGTSNPTMEQAVRRNIWTAGSILYAVPVVGLFLGGLAVLAAEIMIAVQINSDTARRQAWHDKFAGGTQVMKIG